MNTPDGFCVYMNNPYKDIPWWRMDPWSTFCHLFWYMGYCEAHTAASVRDNLKGVR